MEFDATEKKNCYVCGKLGHLKRNCTKKNKKIIPEPTTKSNHENLSWTTCSDDQCKIYRSFIQNVKWYFKKYWGKNQIFRTDFTQRKHRLRR